MFQRQHASHFQIISGGMSCSLQSFVTMCWSWFEDRKTMISSDIIWEIFFIFQTCIGFTGNSLLFTSYMYIFLILPYKKPVDVILAHLTLANALTLIFRGVSNIMPSFGTRPELDDIGYKTVLYIQRVTQNISLYTASFQSTFLALPITPSNCKWAWLKNKIYTFIKPSLLFFWIINMVIFIVVILKTAQQKCHWSRVEFYSLYCKISTCNHWLAVTFLSTIFIQDLFFLSLITCNIIYMGNILFRHHKIAQHVWSAICSLQCFHEDKATHIILILVSCFVFFYWINTFLTVYLNFANKKNWQLENFGNFILSCYLTICTFLLIKNENKISGTNLAK